MIELHVVIVKAKVRESHSNFSEKEVDPNQLQASLTRKRLSLELGAIGLQGSRERRVSVRLLLVQ